MSKVTSRYDCNYLNNEVIRTNKIMAPAFETSFIKDQSWYKDTLFNGAKTSSTLSIILFANLVKCNSTGFNQLIDNVLNVFGTKYEAAKALILSLSDNSIELSKEFLDTINAEELLGTNTITIGKSEASLILVPFEILKGTFQYISAYNLETNFNNDYRIFGRINAREGMEYLSNYLTKNTFTLRNASAIAQSKQTFVDAIQTTCDSYKYIIGEDSEYPTKVKDEIETNIDPIYQKVETCKTAIKNGTKFEFSIDRNNYRVDMGEIFASDGFFNKIIERDSVGRIQFYVSLYEEKYDEDILIGSDLVDKEKISYPVNGSSIATARNTIIARTSDYDERRTNYNWYDDYKWQEFDFAINYRLLNDTFNGLISISPTVNMNDGDYCLLSDIY